MRFKILSPSTFQEANSFLIQHADAKIIAGGTALVLMLRQRLLTTSVLINLGTLENQNFIRLEDDGLHVGALTSLNEMEQSKTVRSFCPALAHAYHVVGNIRIRNQATIAGNLAEADYASDPPAMLMTLDARVKALGSTGTRDILLSDLLLGFYSTCLEPDEIITELIVPNLADNAKATYQKFTSRSAEDRPCVVVGALCEQESDGTCRDLRVVVGAAVETPQRLESIESLAIGQKIDDELIKSIASQYANTLEKLTDVRGSAWYRREMINIHVQRALREVCDVNR